MNFCCSKILNFHLVWTDCRPHVAQNILHIVMTPDVNLFDANNHLIFKF